VAYLRVGGWAMVVEDHWIGPINYKNKYGRVVLLTRKSVTLDFDGKYDWVKIPTKKIVAYDPPNREVK